MKFVLTKLNKFCGEKASFYTIIVDNKYTLFGRFIEENRSSFLPELMNIAGRISNMANVNAAMDNFFKLEESSDPTDDKVVAFYDKPEARLRNYCVKISDRLIILGGGGPKPKWIIKWQQSKKLTQEVGLIMAISKLIEVKIANGQLGISEDGLSFTGNLEIT